MDSASKRVAAASSSAHSTSAASIASIAATSSAAAAAVEPTTTPTDAALEVDRQKAELYKSMKELKELEETLRQQEVQLFNLETRYLEDPTLIGDIMQGWDSHKCLNNVSFILNRDPANAPNGAKPISFKNKFGRVVTVHMRKRRIKPEDRLFSNSSATASHLVKKWEEAVQLEHKAAVLRRKGRKEADGTGAPPLDLHPTLVTSETESASQDESAAVALHAPSVPTIPAAIFTTPPKPKRPKVEDDASSMDSSLVAVSEAASRKKKRKRLDSPSSNESTSDARKRKKKPKAAVAPRTTMPKKTAERSISLKGSASTTKKAAPKELGLAKKRKQQLAVTPLHVQPKQYQSQLSFSAPPNKRPQTKMTTTIVPSNAPSPATSLIPLGDPLRKRSPIGASAGGGSEGGVLRTPTITLGGMSTLSLNTTRLSAGSSTTPTTPLSPRSPEGTFIAHEGIGRRSRNRPRRHVMDALKARQRD